MWRCGMSEVTVKQIMLFIAAGLFFYAGYALADNGGSQAAAGTLGATAHYVTTSFPYIGQLMFATAYLAGIGFTIAAIFKFKQHKDNPTQIPMSTPIALLVIGIVLIFLPNFLKPA